MASRPSWFEPALVFAFGGAVAGTDWLALLPVGAADGVGVGVGTSKETKLAPWPKSGSRGGFGVISLDSAATGWAFIKIPFRPGSSQQASCQAKMSAYLFEIIIIFSGDTG